MESVPSLHFWHFGDIALFWVALIYKNAEITFEVLPHFLNSDVGVCTEKCYSGQIKSNDIFSVRGSPSLSSLPPPPPPSLPPPPLLPLPLPLPLPSALLLLFALLFICMIPHCVCTLSRDIREILRPVFRKSISWIKIRTELTSFFSNLIFCWISDNWSLCLFNLWWFWVMTTVSNIGSYTMM